VSHCGLTIYIKKYLKAKEEEELWKLKYFTMQKFNLQNNPLKETKILQAIITLELITSFNTSHNIIFQKSSYESSRHIYIQGPKSLKLLYILCNESKHNILAFVGKANKTITTNIVIVILKDSNYSRTFYMISKLFK
jgi:hypothetical protein